MRYDDRYTDDTHGMAEPATVIPPKPEPKLNIERLAEPTVSVQHDPAVNDAIEREDEMTDEEKDAELTRYECERQAIAFETNRMMKLAVNALAELSKRRDFPLDLVGYELLISQCRMLAAHGCSEDALLQLHHIMWPDSKLFAPMKRFPKRYRSGPITKNVISLDSYRPRTAGTPQRPPPAA